MIYAFYTIFGLSCFYLYLGIGFYFRAKQFLGSGQSRLGRELQGLSQSRWSAALVRHDGRLFLMGGRVTGVDGPRPTPVTASVETYDVGALAE